MHALASCDSATVDRAMRSSMYAAVDSGIIAPVLLNVWCLVTAPASFHAVVDSDPQASFHTVVESA